MEVRSNERVFESRTRKTKRPHNASAKKLGVDCSGSFQDFEISAIVDCKFAREECQRSLKSMLKASRARPTSLKNRRKLLLGELKTHFWHSRALGAVSGAPQDAPESAPRRA